MLINVTCFFEVCLGYKKFDAKKTLHNFRKKEKETGVLEANKADFFESLQLAYFIGEEK